MNMGHPNSMSPPIQMDILLNHWDKFFSIFADFPGSLNQEYILRQLKMRNADITTVTNLNDKGTCPLLEFLRSPNCSSEVLKQLFFNGVDVNANNQMRRSALVTALHRHAKNPPVIKAILKAGADINTLNFYENCVVCIALFNEAPLEVFKLLFRAGAHPTCREWIPALHHATRYSDPKERREVLKLFIDAGASLDTLSQDGRSVLCHALHKVESRQDTDLLIQLGIPTDACTVHPSPILCALDRGGRKLPLDVADSLLGPFENPMSGHDFLYRLPHSIRRYTRFSLEPSELWLELERSYSPEEDEFGTLLHAVAYNTYCTQDLIELLANRGVPVGKKNSRGETAVHIALKRVEDVQSVLDTLLKRGCPVDAVDWGGRTALAYAILLEKDSKVLKVLLNAGALVSVPPGSSVLETALEHHSDKKLFQRLEKKIRRENPDIPGRKQNWMFLRGEYTGFEEKLIRVKWDCLQILLLYSFLENPELDIELLTRERSDARIIKSFARQCLIELRNFGQKEIGNGHTLLDFIRRDLSQKLNFDLNLGENFDFDQLLKVLLDTKFSNYLDMILERVPRELMERNLHQLRVYTVRNSPRLQIFILNYQCVTEIAKYLFNKDLMNFILAFHNCVIPTASKSGDE